MTAAIRNISVRKEAEKRLAQMEHQYRGLLEAAPDAMVISDLNGHILLVNSAMERLFGYDAEELVGQAIEVLMPERFRVGHVGQRHGYTSHLRPRPMGEGLELCGLRKDNTEFPAEISLSPMEGAEGILVTAAIRDISDRKKTEERMAEMKTAHEALRLERAAVAYSAQHDSLTGLPNRMLLHDRINQAIASAARHKNKLAVFFLDLDDFKRINDSMGHSTGDKLLQSVARRLLDCVRGSDTVSRHGGDEFVVLLSELEKSEDSTMAVKRMLHAVERAHPIDERQLHVTTSIGVSIYPDDGLDAEALIGNADLAMYEAKGSGRRTFRFFKPAMSVRGMARRPTDEDLQRAHEVAESE